MRGSWTLVAFALACSRTGAVVWEEPPDAGDMPTVASDAAQESPKPPDKPDAGCAMNACGECAPLPEEECNGRDDNCDGRIDENCSLIWPGLERAKTFRLHGTGVVATVSDRHGSFSAYSGGDPLVFAAAPGETPKVLNENPASDAGVPDHTFLDGIAFDGRWIVAEMLQGFMAVDLAAPLQILKLSTSHSGEASVAVDASRAVIAYAGKLRLWEPPAATSTRLTETSALEAAPDIAGNWVVFERRYATEATPEIRAFELGTKLMDNPSQGLGGTHTSPQISGKRIVWTRSIWDANERRQLNEIWLYDLETHARTKLADGANARIDGDRICWQAQGQAQGVWLHDATSDRSARVSTAGSACDVSGTRVAWLGTSGLAFRDLETEEL